MRKIGFGVLLALCACSPAQNGAHKEAATPAKPDARPVYALRSNVPGASLVQVAQLPATNELPVESESSCDTFFPPDSAAGKLAVQRGWRVLHEERFRQFQVVLIARGGDPLTSGRCNYIDANIALFDGDRLIGVLYPKGKAAIRIAAMEIVDGHLRVWSTDPGAQGQINLSGNDLTFDPITGSDAVCDGKYRVPAVFGLPYSQARRTLLASGWAATPSKEDILQSGGYAEARRRYPELDNCAGTGYGECAFTLTARDGAAKLRIITLGDIDAPVFSNYSVSCDGKGPDEES